ncbi:MAG: T9SS type A sorting domain-containing protein [Lentimicrobium sp.]|nr:T9SS type A sorting domain-containing protein [Lentimicrobium sp.]
MKTISFYCNSIVLVILSFFPLTASSQQSDWIWQNPLPQGNDLYQVNIIDQNLTYAVGNGGTVMKSADGGYSWDILNTGTTKNLRQADFLQNGLTGFAIGYAQGEGSVAIKTTDGGINWHNLSINPIYYLSSIDFIDEQTGFVGGNLGIEFNYIFKTTDGGLNWSLSGPLDEGIIAIRFPFDNLTGFAAGHNYNTGNTSIYKTIDSGSTWVKKSIPALSSFSDIKSFCFVSDQIGYAAGAGTILKTIDSGETWFSVYTGNDPYKSICFPENETTGYVVGDFNIVLKTIDGGNSWQPLNTNVSGTHFYNSVAFVDNQSGFIVGTHGIILKTTDGGTNWLDLRTGIPYPFLNSINFPVNSQTGYIAGFGGVILKTADGGGNWVPQSTNTTKNLIKIRFLDNDTGYAVGDYGTILKTSDGGQNWNSLVSGFNQIIYDVDFPVNSLTGYVCGESGKLAKTTDGGATWSPIGSFNKDIMAMCFPTDNLIGYVATAYEKIYKTTDGGITWDIKHDGNSPQSGMADIIFPFDAQTGYAVSSTGGQNNSRILKTTDGGNSWTISDAGTTSVLYEISFPTTLIGYIAADGIYGDNPSRFLKTTDGGLTWKIVGVPYGYSLTSVCFPNGADTGYVTGNTSGAILKTINGGGTLTSIFETPPENQNSTNLLFQNYPNPFNENTTISWKLNKRAHVILKVYDFMGREIKTLVDCVQPKGEHTAKFISPGLPAGIYFYQLQTNGRTQTKKMLLIK